MELPIVCTLTESELNLRRRTVLDPLKETALASEEMSDGYAYIFPASAEVLAQLSRVVELESQCCQFLTFRIIVQAARQPIRLEVVGGRQAKSVIADFFGGAKSSVVLESAITCPACGHVESLTMPVNQCVFFYECESCHERLRPKPGDCCVFCSYGSVACPVIQRAFKSE
jgi:hypothetical protein